MQGVNAVPPGKEAGVVMWRGSNISNQGGKFTGTVYTHRGTFSEEAVAHSCRGPSGIRFAAPRVGSRFVKPCEYRPVEENSSM